MYERIEATANYIKEKIKTLPKIGIVCGSGLAGIVERIKTETILPYNTIPNFPLSTVEGHKSNLIFGSLGGKPIVAMQGRFHYYEGYSMQEVTFGIRVMKALGVEKLILTNAAGGVNPEYKVCDIMIVEDHINLLPNPLIGKNDERLGIRFPAMHKAYSKKMIKDVEDIAQENNIQLRKGIYLGSSGPTFETPAEYRYFRTIGADTVGMSTVPEVIVGVHSGMEVFALSLVSNIFDDNVRAEATMQEVLESGKAAEEKMMFLIEELIARQ